MVWCRGSALVSINEVTLCQARLILGWVIMFGFNSRRGTHVTGHPGQLSLAILLRVDAMSTSQRAVTPCGWEVTVGVACVWVAGKTV